MVNKNPELPFPNSGAIVVLDDRANSAERGEGFDFSGGWGIPVSMPMFGSEATTACKLKTTVGENKGKQ